MQLALTRMRVKQERAARRHAHQMLAQGAGGRGAVNECFHRNAGKARVGVPAGVRVVFDRVDEFGWCIHESLLYALNGAHSIVTGLADVLNDLVVFPARAVRKHPREERRLAVPGSARRL